MEQVFHHIIFKGIEEAVHGAVMGEAVPDVVLIIIVIALLAWIVSRFRDK